MRAIDYTDTATAPTFLGVAYRAASENDAPQPARATQTGIAGYWLTGITAAAAVLAVGAMDLATVPKDFSVTSRVLTPKTLSPSVTQQREAVLNEMLGYRDLEAGWDGTGSQPPMPGAIECAAVFLLAIPLGVTPPESTVSADGSVGWFWTSSETSISIHFSGGNNFAYYAKSKPKDMVARGESIFDGKSIPDDLLQIMYLV
ncbi:hypothetical protein NKH95_25795 [Mesorhizobium sp. M0848]|uniref:hypothetical protein n=1 Tax=Mesorhizobium sp. M0848 TaxID=2957012 RepID=UPI0033360526